MKKIIAILLLIIIFVMTESIDCFANDEAFDIVDEINFDEFGLGKADVSRDLIGIDFRSLVKEIITAQNVDGRGLVEIGLQALVWQLKNNQRGFTNILILAVISAVFTNFARAFKSKTISETGVFVTLLAILALLFSCLYLSADIADDAIGSSVNFMKGAMPVLAMAVAANGGTASALVINELLLGLITIIYWLLQFGVLKIAGTYAAFSMVNSLSKEKSLSKLCRLINKAGSWLVKTSIGLVVGIGTIQSLVVPVADSVKSNVLTKALSIIPGIGNGVSAVSSTVLGAGCLVKNSIGAASLIVVLAICLVPVIKIAIFMLMYKLLAAILEPICDSRIVNCINDVATAIKLQLSAVVACAGLFMISIAIICSSTNLGYLAG